MEEWHTYFLKDIATFSQGIQVDIDNQFIKKDNGLIRFIRIIDYSKNNEPPRYISCPKNSYIVNDDDIVMIRYGSQTAGKVVRGISGAIANNMFKITLNNNIITNEYAYYYLSQTSVFNNLRGSQSSSTMPAITFGLVGRQKILLPNIRIQEKITTILSSLDDKIELNRRINENLEQQAQALFKSWFVDFEPFKDGKFVDSELGMIPEGWKVVETNKFMKISRNSINPTKNPNILYAHYSIPAYDETGLPIFQYGDEIKSNKQEVADNMTLVSKLNPRIKRVWFVEKACENAICSTEFIPYQSLNNSPYFLYCYLNSKIFYDSIMTSVNGATGSHQRFQANDTLMYLFPYNEEIIYKFNTIVSGIMIHKSRLIRENMKLAQLRDTLLPKLMSGELKLSEMETKLDE